MPTKKQTFTEINGLKIGARVSCHFKEGTIDGEVVELREKTFSLIDEKTSKRVSRNYESIIERF